MTRDPRPVSPEPEQQGATEVDCPSCDGCGKVANTEEREPWTAWMSLPVGSAIAVVMGIVRPITCQRCSGTGKVSAHA